MSWDLKGLTGLGRFFFFLSHPGDAYCFLLTLCSGVTSVRALGTIKCAGNVTLVELPMPCLSSIHVCVE